MLYCPEGMAKNLFHAHGFSLKTTVVSLSHHFLKFKMSTCVEACFKAYTVKVWIQHGIRCILVHPACSPIRGMFCQHAIP